MANVNLGNCYRKQGKLGAAARQYEIALSFKSADCWVQNNLGNIYEEMNDMARAMEQYERAIKCDVHDPEFQTDIANAYLKTDRIADALVHYRALLKIVEGLPAYRREENFARDMITKLEEEQRPGAEQ